METVNILISIWAILFFAGFLISRYLNKKALTLLNQEEKARLIDLQSGQSLLPLFIYLVPPFLIFVLNDFLRQYVNEWGLDIFMFAWIILYFAYSMNKSYSMLKTNQFPVAFIRLNVIAAGIRVFAFLFLIVISLFL